MIRRGLLIIVGVIVALGLVFTCTTTVSSGYTGVVVRLGAVQDTVLNEGFHFKLPFITKIIKINNQVLRTDVEGESASKDLQTVSSVVSVNYNIDKDKSAYLYKTVGRSYEDVVLRPAVQEVVKSVVSRYTAEELITERQNVGAAMKDELASKVSDYGINIREINIINFAFSAEFNAAIEAKQTAQQNALKAEQDLARIKVEAQQKVEQAKGEAEANRLKNQEITDNILKQQMIEKWDGKLPTVMGNSDTMLDIDSLLN